MKKGFYEYLLLIKLAHIMLTYIIVTTTADLRERKGEKRITCFVLYFCKNIQGCCNGKKALRRLTRSKDNTKKRQGEMWSKRDRKRIFTQCSKVVYIDNPNLASKTEGQQP